MDTLSRNLRNVKFLKHISLQHLITPTGNLPLIQTLNKVA